MSITLPSESTVLQYYIQLFQAQNSTWDLSDKSFFGLLARAMAQGTMLLMDAVADADADSVPAYKQDSDGTLLSRCSSAALDAWAITYGLPSGAAGVYGRKGAQGSSGGIGLPTASIGATLIAAGSALTDSTGQVTVQTTAAVTTDGPPNTLTVSLESVTTGTAANLAAGNVLTWTAPPAGVSSTMTLTTGMTGGSDRETDGDLLARILFRLQNPPRGGTAADYRYWAEASTDATQNNATNNIYRAYVYPLRSGLGSVDVVPLISGSGTSRVPSTTVIAAVQTYLDSVRPVTATVTALQASQPATIALRVQVSMLAQVKYGPDWVDAGNSTGISAFNAGAKSISCVMPAALKAAVDAGQNPRIQVIVSTTGASPKPVQARVLSYVAGAPDVMTLSSWPFTVNPTAGTDYFFAGGPYVDGIATNILSYVDSLGPSRVSGFADEYDVWEYEFTPARIADIVMEYRDTDGTRMIRDIPNLGTTGILIAVGAGAFAAGKFTPKDIAAAPELAYLRAGGIEILGNT